MRELLNKFLKENSENFRVDAVMEINNQLFSVKSDLLAVMKNIKSKAAFAGEHLGWINNGVFVPSIYLVVQMNDYAKRIAVVKSKAAWLFICGRDILKKAIVSNNALEGELVFVRDEKGRCLGIGKVDNSGIKRVLDIGEYIRRERRKGKTRSREF